MQRLVEVYRRNGRFDVRVVPKIIELPNNRVDWFSKSRKGTRLASKRSLIRQQSLFTISVLKDVIKTSENNLSFLKSSDVYDPDRIEADRDLLRRFYLKHGFADVRITSPVTSEFDPAAKGLHRYLQY